jgi:exopolysaccharide biosynthesis operon protein EpsL
MKGAKSIRLSVGALTLLAVASCFADSGDLLALNIGLTRDQDNNLFRRPENGSLGPIASDQITTTRLDLSLNKQYSLQRLKLKLGLTDNRYETFKALNSLNENFSADWQWQATSKISGNLSSSRSQSQTDFADFRGGGQNIRTTETKRLDSNWQATGGWSLGAGVSRTGAINSQTFQQDSSSEQSIVDGNLTYRFASGRSLALLVSNSRGKTPGVADPVTLSDNRFSVRQHDLKLNWPISGVTTLSGGVGQVRRTHDNFSVRDYFGINGNAVVNWAPTGKTQFTLTRSRAVESWQESNSSFAVRNLTGFAASWLATPKVSIRANANWTERRFGGDIPGQPINDRIDKILSTSLGIDWTAHNKIRLGAMVINERRDSTLASTDYRSRRATLTANIEF